MAKKYSLNISNQALDDLDEITEYYDILNKNDGAVFYEHFDTVCLMLEKSPRMFQKKIGRHRRAFIKNYPYVIYYFIREPFQTIYITAILHEKRGIEYIRKKLSGK